MKLETGQYWEFNGTVIQITEEVKNHNFYESRAFDYIFVESPDKIGPIYISQSMVDISGKYLKAYNTPLWKVLNE